MCGDNSRKFVHCKQQESLCSWFKQEGAQLVSEVEDKGADCLLCQIELPVGKGEESGVESEAR